MQPAQTQQLSFPLLSDPDVLSILAEMEFPMSQQELLQAAPERVR